MFWGMEDQQIQAQYTLIYITLLDNSDATTIATELFHFHLQGFARRAYSACIDLAKSW
jgi:hypothetical protein